MPLDDTEQTGLPPPPGFTSMQPATTPTPAAGIPPLPPGFTLLPGSEPEAKPDTGPKDTGIFGAIPAGLMHAGKGLMQTGEAITGGTPKVETPEILAAQPVEWKDLWSPRVLAQKALYGLAESAPMFATSVLGGAIGSAVGGGPETPLGWATGIAGTAAGAAVGSTVQSLGVNFGQALQETNGDREAAWKIAEQRTGIGAAGSGVAFGLFAYAPFSAAVKNTVFKAFGLSPATQVAGERAVADAVAKGTATSEQQAAATAARAATPMARVKDIALQAGIAQPSTAVLEHIALNLRDGKDPLDNISAAIPGAIVGTAVPMLAHEAVRRINERRFSPETTPATAAPGEENGPPVPPGGIDRKLGPEDFAADRWAHTQARLAQLGEEDRAAHAPFARQAQEEQFAADYEAQQNPYQPTTISRPTTAEQRDRSLGNLGIRQDVNAEAALRGDESALPDRGKAAAERGEVPWAEAADNAARDRLAQAATTAVPAIPALEQARAVAEAQAAKPADTTHTEIAPEQPAPAPFVRHNIRDVTGQERAPVQAQTGPAFAPPVPEPTPTPPPPRVTPQVPALPGMTPGGLRPPEPAPVTPPQFTPVPEANYDKPPPAFTPVPNGNSTAFTYRGEPVPVEYAVVDARQLIASNNDDLSPNLDFPQNLQPRDRTRTETELQIQNLTNPRRFQPEMLGPSPEAGSGTPIVGADGVVEGGNARTIALRRAYDQNLPVAETYRNWLASQGYPVDGIEQPMLVRINRANMDPAQREAFARDMNIPPQAAMSPIEQAMADSRQITSAVLATYQGGEITSAANRPFLRGILRAIVPENQYGAFIAPDGGVTRPGLRRIEAALLSRAYSDSGIVAKLVEDADNNFKAIGNGMLDAAPSWAQMRAAVAEGRVPQPFDITEHLLGAVRLIDHAREQNRNVAEFVQQTDMFGGGIPAETEGVLGWLLGNKDFTKRFGRDKISAALTDYAESAQRAGQAPLPGQELAGVQQLIEGSRQRAQGAAGDLFDPTVGQPPGAGPVRPGADQNRPEIQGPRADAAGVESPAGGAPAAGERGAAEPTGGTAPGVTPPAEAPSRSADYGANNKLVTNDEVAAIRERMRKKLNGSQLNAGIDPELMIDGAKLAVYHIEAGARKFADFAREMLADMGESIRPYLKMFYNSARDWPEFDHAAEMSPHTEMDRVIADWSKPAAPEATPEPAPTPAAPPPTVTPPAAEPPPAPKTPIQETMHAKKGTPLFVVKIPGGRVDDATYAGIKKQAVDLGGYYSSWAKNGAIPGFQFGDRVSAERFARLMDDHEAAKNGTKPPAPPPADIPNTPEGKTIALADRVSTLLDTGEKITAKSLHDEAVGIFGGSLAEGKVSRDQLYDALELGVNKYLAKLRLDPSVDLTHALDHLRGLEKLKSELPTQSVRAGEKDTYQQFSTPPDYAYAAAWIANLHPTDRVLEPSAGTGSLAVHAMNAGVRDVTVNELSKNRAPLVESLNPKRAFREDAEQLHNILPTDIKPTVVLMNPPFSVAPERMAGRQVLMAGARHVEQALQRLEPGGRLVAIVGRGMKPYTGEAGGFREGNGSSFRDWWNEISSQYNVRANVGVDGKVYAKYGTTFDTRLLVIDKDAPTGEAPITGEVGSLAELMQRLEGVRNDWVREQGTAASEPVAAEPVGEAVAPGGERGSGADDAVPPATGEPGVRAGDSDTGAGPELPGRPGSGGGPDAEPGRGPGEADGVVPEQPQRPEGTGGTEPDAPVAPRPGEDLGGSGGAGDGVVPRPDTSGEPGVPPSGESPELARETPTETVRVQEAEAAPGGEINENIYEPYRPQRVTIEGAVTHPSPLVQSAAMASVLPPKTDYAPKFGHNFVRSGVLSDAQLEAVTYAGHAHSQMLPANEGETAYRRGFFIGDGTGVGKGREIAGVILDNWNQGRKKAVWVSENETLANDARRDWSGVGGDAGDIFELGDTKRDDSVRQKNGIAFVPYTTLSSGSSATPGVKHANGTKIEIRNLNAMGERYVQGESPTAVLSGKISKYIKKNGDDFYNVKLDNGTVIESVDGRDMEVKGTPPRRLDQLINWLGEDFDGVIAFDESHNMANSIQTVGKPPANKALTGIELQQRLPNARVVYVSATGATEVMNLAYAERLGLWGPGTAFPTKREFISQIADGGIAAMELVARDMKAMGHYVARSLSYDGVDYDRVEHKLTPEQSEIYDKMAEGWQVTLNNMQAALQVTGAAGSAGGAPPAPGAKRAVNSAFWGGHQRFFNQIITSMQMPSVIEGIERDLANKKQVVLQLVNTNEAAQNRAVAKVKRPEDLEDLDMTPRDQLMQLIDKSFPTQQYEEFFDANGNPQMRPVVDSQGKPVQNRQAVAMKERLLDQIGSIRVPDGPLEILLNHFGTDKIAEVTGRTQRVVKKLDDQGQMRTVVEKRVADNANVAETDAFQNAKKPILVFSRAGGTGRSYHAENGTPSSNNPRSHYLIQAGWRADNAIQGFGRTHRTNQASEPFFHLVTTDLQGQKRFISSIARRLAQLGALTKGERRTGDQGMFSASDNLESREASNGLYQLYRDMFDDWRNPNAAPRVSIDIDTFEQQTGLRLRTDGSSGQPVKLRDDLPPITQFLNRLLSLKIEPQNRLFGEFETRLNDAVERAASNGTLDSGLETIRADHIHKREESTVYTEPQSGAETNYVKLELQHRNHPATFDQIAAGEGPTSGRQPLFYVQSKRYGKVYAVSEATNVTTATGAVRQQYRLSDPLKYQYTTRDRIDGADADQHWNKIDSNAQARALWDAQVAGLPTHTSEDLHLITGVVLPIWDRINAGSPRIYRLQTDAGEKMLGRAIPEPQIDAVLRNLGAERAAQEHTPQDIVDRIGQGGQATLVNGWKLGTRMVAGEPRIEVTGPNYTHDSELSGAGIYSERIDFRTRYFVPTGDGAAESIRKLVERHPVSELSSARPDEGIGPLAAESNLASGYSPTAAPHAIDRLDDFHTFAADREQNPHVAARDYVMDRGRASGHEHAVVTDASNTPIHASTSGAAAEVSIDGIEQQLRDPNNRLTIHHSHEEERSTPLSGADISYLGYPGVDQILAHGSQDGALSAARLTPKTAEYLRTLSPEDAAAWLYDASARAGEAVTPSIRMQILSKKLSGMEEDRVYHALRNRALEAAGVIDYIGTHDVPLSDQVQQSVVRRAAEAVQKGTKFDLGGKDRINDTTNQRADAVRPDRAMADLFGEGAGDGSGRPEQPNRAQDGQASARRADAAPEGGRGQGLARPLRSETAAAGDFSREAMERDSTRVMVKGVAPTVQGRAKSWWDSVKDDRNVRFKQAFLDNFAALEAAEKGLNAGKLALASLSATIRARLAINAPHVAAYMIGKRTARGFEGGAVRWNAEEGVVEAIPGSKSLMEHLAPLFDAGLDVAYANWKIAERAGRLKAEGRERNVDDDFIAKYTDLPSKLSADQAKLLREADAGWRSHNKAILDFGEATGLVNGEGRALWENNGDYVPFYRALEETIAGPSGAGGRNIANMRSPVRRLKGGEDKIADLYDNMLRNTAAMVDRGMRNTAMQAAVDLLHDTGVLTSMSKVARLELNSDEGRARLTAMGLDYDTMSAKAKEAARDMFGMLKTKDPDLVSVMRDGKPVYYKVEDPLLLRSLVSLGPREVSGIMKLLGAQRMLLTRLVTADPAYMIANLMRDSAAAWAMGHDVTPVMSTMKGLVSSLSNSPSAMALIAGGAMGHERYRPMAGGFRKAMQDPSKVTVLNSAKAVGRAIEKLTNASEQANRIAVYDAAIAKGLGKAEALRQSQDLLNFSMRGDNAILGKILDTVPFLNARVQGLYKLGRAAVENPKTMLLRGGMLMALALANWYNNKDNPEYQKLEEWDKQYATHLFFGGQHFAVPVPFELGAMFMSLPEMLANYSQNGRDKQLIDAFSKMMLNQLNMNITPGIAQPWLDVYANKDSFTGRPIVTQLEGAGSKTMQYGPRTSSTAIGIAELTGLSDTYGLGAEQVEHLIRGYGGTIGAYALAAVDALGGATGISREHADKRASQIPVLSRFYRGSDEEAPASFRNRWTTEFYDLRGEVSKLQADFNKIKKEDPKALAQFVRDNQAKLGLHSTLEVMAKDLSRIRGQATQIEMNASLTGAQKREREDTLIAAQNRIVERIRPLIQRAEGLASRP